MKEFSYYCSEYESYLKIPVGVYRLLEREVIS